MEENIKYKLKFNEDGFFICKNIFDKNFIQEILDEIYLATDTVKYFDHNKNLRRIEKLYDKGVALRALNDKLIFLMKEIFQEDFLIFKDKFNAKPPGGDGFFAHYDGIFHFRDDNNIVRNGWYEYDDKFVNVLVALDSCDISNGALELAKHHKGSFNDLIKNTKNDGTPALKEEIEKKEVFNLINLNIGDIVVFSNKCPHRSKKNNTKKNRRIIYYTYSSKKNGSQYDQYFEDKKKSKNTSKALLDKK
tara:strand:- start:389 stop:1132 length:744 start_codon:yes stop_codon:yes gene_type:complete